MCFKIFTQEIVFIYSKEDWGQDKEAVINCINIQADAWASIPDDMNNMYISKFTDTMHETINFKMLLIAFYNEKITLREFKDINYGNVEYINKV